MNDQKELSYIDKKLLVLDQSKKEIQLEIDKRSGSLLIQRNKLDEEILYLKKLKRDIENDVSPETIIAPKKPHWTQLKKVAEAEAEAAK